MIEVTTEVASSLVRAAARGATEAKGSRQVVAAAVSAAIRTLTQHSSQDEANPLEWRVQAQRKALAAHDAMNKLTGSTHHNLGTATKAAVEAKAIDAEQANALRRVRRKANRARHTWRAMEHGRQADGNDPSLCYETLVGQVVDGAGRKHECPTRSHGQSGSAPGERRGEIVEDASATTKHSHEMMDAHSSANCSDDEHSSCSFATCENVSAGKECALAPYKPSAPKTLSCTSLDSPSCRNPRAVVSPACAREPLETNQQLYDGDGEKRNVDHELPTGRGRKSHKSAKPLHGKGAKGKGGKS